MSAAVAGIWSCIMQCTGQQTGNLQNATNWAFGYAGITIQGALGYIRTLSLTNALSVTHSGRLNQFTVMQNGCRHSEKTICDERTQGQ